MSEEGREVNNAEEWLEDVCQELKQICALLIREVPGARLSHEKHYPRRLWDAAFEAKKIIEGALATKE